MNLLKNGKIVLDGTRTEQETEDLLLAALELIIDKNVNIILAKNFKKASQYNLYRGLGQKPLKGTEFKILKEILQ